jgi:3-isopropylmalate/(R)-2-methylmalate dehydratase small subunit
MMILKNQHSINIPGPVSTDDILPAVYKHSSIDPKDFRSHLFENKSPGLASRLGPNTIIVNDAIFGIGSSREQAVSALKSAGITAIIAPRFGRIFFRNAWNLSLPCFEIEVLDTAEGQNINIDFQKRTISIGTSEYLFPAIPEIMISICLNGGLLSYYKKMSTYEP